MCRRHLASALVALLATLALARAAHADEPIRDNSFLIEEAYNQEPRVIQHISTLSIDEESGSWAYSFTEEWPVFSQTHQASVTVPLQGNGDVALGDLLLNYRYQILASGGRVALAPRLSAVLPTGDPASGHGAGGAGVQVNLPLSVELGSLVTHTNVGATLIPSAESAAGDSAATFSWSVGQSVIWLVHPKVNLMLEGVFTRAEAVTGEDLTDSADSLVLSPGIRGALDLPGGLQVVPGLAVPIGIGPSEGELLIFGYLSFEHPI